MRNTTFLMAMVVAALTVSASAQNPQENPRDRRTGSETARPATPAEGPALDASTFVKDLGIAGMTEVRLGKIAAERAVSADVKAFGQMMVRDHTEAGLALAEAASQLNLQMPTAPDAKHQELIDRLSALPGQDFDREYMAAMVKGHEEVVAKVRARAGAQYTSTTPAGPDRAELGAGASPVAGNAGAEPSDRRVGTSGRVSGADPLATWAAKALPTVQHHLEEARKLQRTAR